MNIAQGLLNWNGSWKQKRFLVRVRRRLRHRTGPSWILFLTALFLVCLSGCASQPLPATPPKELMVPPPPPGAITDRLEAILKQGQTSAPTSTP